MSEVVPLYGSSVDPLGALLVAALVVVWLLAWYFSGAQRTKRKLRSAQLWSIGELPESTLGRVIGQVQALDRTLVGPLTGRPCVCYFARVDVRRTIGGTSPWKTIIKESRCVPFRLVDQTGHAIVDPLDAQVALTSERTSSSGTFDDATPAEEAFLAKHGHASKGRVFNKDLRYTEEIIEIGETIAVLGSGVREGDPTARPPDGYRSPAPTRLRLTGSSRFPLVIGDDPSTTQR